MPSSIEWIFASIALMSLSTFDSKNIVVFLLFARRNCTHSRNRFKLQAYLWGSFVLWCWRLRAHAWRRGLWWALYFLSRSLFVFREAGLIVSLWFTSYSKQLIILISMIMLFYDWWRNLTPKIITYGVAQCLIAIKYPFKNFHYHFTLVPEFFSVTIVLK